jgi:hypothetical protein
LCVVEIFLWSTRPIVDDVDPLERLLLVDVWYRSGKIEIGIGLDISWSF